ncbi:kinase-like domain-containing protein [Gymnopilus junonius]|uniref:EKC/KEOPS complex subunit BUD32 n=1 Tax=Gymnopilus junonius TaxID=109634 RepID=A0A9P5NP36_GYMJU|nr:kinase-like domain-containing protein [Gymnopilus junonius]
MASISASEKLLASSRLISQGAEAKVYKGSLTAAGGVPVLFKHRFKKQYRHPTLDATLTKARVAGEARALLRCLRSGVNVPGVRMVDAAEGLLGIEWIDGSSVKRLLPSGAQDGEEDQGGVADDHNPLDTFPVSVVGLMRLIGVEIAKMHLADIIHGDLTTSNMMLRPSSSSDTQPDLVLIDFGLSYHSTLVEDKAVDLYVLERAFASTHPDSEPMFASVLEAYGAKMGKEWPALRRRLDDVRLRGRKRSMVG